MDKYEYRVSLNEINSLVDEKRFDEAAQIADTIDWRKVKSKDTLCRISDIYKVCKDYERARDILDLANQRNPHVPEIIYSLCELTIFLYGKTGSQVDLTKAIGLRQEYQNECPNDPKRLILEYKFYKVSPVTLTEKIATLERLRDEDHSARWGYELASLYHEAGMEDLALDECQTIRRSFGGRFAERAAVLADEIKAAGDAQREQAEDESGTAEPEEQAPAVAAQESGTEREEAAASVDTAVSEVEETTEQAEHVAPERETAPVQEAAAEPVQIPEEPERNEAPETDVQAEAGYEPETPVEKAPEQTDAPDTTSDDQLSVGQVYDEWERIRKDIRKRNDEKRAQRIMEDTGPLLQDFDETARHGLIEAIEKDAARERRQIRSGASSILGGDAGYGRSDRYGQGGDRYRDSYDDRRGRDAYDDSYDRGYDDRRYEDSYDDRYAEPYDDRDRYAEPAEDSYDRRGYAEEPYEDRGYARSADDRYDDRYAYEPLPQPEDTYEEPAPRRDEIHAETVHEEPDGYTDDVRGAENDRWSPARAAMDVAGDAIGAAQQRRGSRFQAAVTAAGAAANVGGAVAGDLADAASEDDDIATRRWNSDEIRQAMEAQSRRMAEAQAAAEEEARRKAEEEEQARIAAEEEARRKAAEEEARRAAEARAAAEAEQRARMEAEIRARYEAEEKARIEAEEKARREAEEKAAAEARAREEEEAKARMYAEIEARIRAEFEEREQARLAALGISNAPVSDAGDAATTEPAAVQAEPAAEDSAASEERSVQEPAADAVEEEPVPEVAVYTEEPAYGAEPLTEDTAFTQNSDPEQGLDQTSSFDTTAFLAATLAQDAESDEESIDEPSRGRRGRGTGEDAAQDTFGQAAPVVSPETAEMPASAASSIAAASEKAPSEEELRLFGPFYRMKENRDQVTAALDRISLASYTGNLIITGNAVTARRVAQGLLELTREADSNFTGRIAKATGTALNKLTTEKFQGILNKIQNGALIIEHASTMEGPAIQCLYNELENRDRGVVVVIMDARKPLDAFLAQYSDLVGSFTARVDIRPLNDKALVDYGKDYANAKDYALDELAELALSSRISGMQTPNHRVTLKEVRDIIDEAISYASKKSPKVLMDMISHKRYDEDDRVILHEKDFQHY